MKLFWDKIFSAGFIVYFFLIALGGYRVGSLFEIMHGVTLFIFGLLVFFIPSILVGILYALLTASLSISGIIKEKHNIEKESKINFEKSIQLKLMRYPESPKMENCHSLRADWSINLCQDRNFQKEKNFKEEKSRIDKLNSVIEQKHFSTQKELSFFESPDLLNIFFISVILPLAEISILFLNRQNLGSGFNYKADVYRALGLSRSQWETLERKWGFSPMQSKQPTSKQRASDKQRSAEPENVYFFDQKKGA